MWTCVKLQKHRPSILCPHQSLFYWLNLFPLIHPLISCPLRHVLAMSFFRIAVSCAKGWTYWKLAWFLSSAKWWRVSEIVQRLFMWALIRRDWTCLYSADRQIAVLFVGSVLQEVALTDLSVYSEWMPVDVHLWMGVIERKRGKCYGEVRNEGGVGVNLWIDPSVSLQPCAEH